MLRKLAFSLLPCKSGAVCSHSSLPAALFPPFWVNFTHSSGLIWSTFCPPTPQESLSWTYSLFQQMWCFLWNALIILSFCADICPPILVQTHAILSPGRSLSHTGLFLSWQSGNDDVYIIDAPWESKTVMLNKFCFYFQWTCISSAVGGLDYSTHTHAHVHTFTLTHTHTHTHTAFFSMWGS